MFMHKPIVFLFAGVNTIAANGSSDEYQTPGTYRTSFYLKATGGSVGATVNIMAKSPNGDWHLAGTASLAAAGNTVVTVDGVHTAFRIDVASWTAGTISASANAIAV